MGGDILFVPGGGLVCWDELVMQGVVSARTYLSSIPCHPSAGEGTIGLLHLDVSLLIVTNWQYPQ